MVPLRLPVSPPFPSAGELARRLLLVGLLVPAMFALSGCEQTTVSVLDVASVEISPDHLALFQGDEAPLTVTLRERGGGVVTGRQVSWSSEEPDIATVDADGVVEAHARGSTMIFAESEGVQGSAEIVVLLPPWIEPSTSSISFEGEAGSSGVAEESIGVTNAGEGTLDGLGVSARAAGGGSAPWLTAVLGGSTAPTSLTLRARSGDLSAGTYEGVAELTSPVARNSPVEVAVRFEVRAPPPEIRVAPSSVSFSASAGAHEPATVTVRVENAGGGTLTPIGIAIRYQGEASGWLTAIPAGTTAPTDLEIQASSRFLSAGEYHATVEVSSPVARNRSVEVAVRFIVQ